MKLPSPRLVFIVTFLGTFALCAIFLNNCPSTGSWVQGTTDWQIFWTQFSWNWPAWAIMSLLVAGLGTGLDLLMRRVFRQKLKV